MDPAQRFLYARYGVTPVDLVARAAADGAPSASSDAKAAAPKPAPKAAPAAAPAAAAAKPAEPARNAPAPAAAAADAKAGGKASDKKGDKSDKKGEKKPEPKPKAAADAKAKVDKSKDPTALRMAEEGRKRAEAMKNMTADEKKAYRKAEDAKKAADAAAAAAAAPKPAAAPKAGAAPAAAAAGAGAGAAAKPAAAAGAGADAKDAKSGGDDANVTVKVPKGARDIEPAQMVIREKAFNMIRGVFQRHGAVEIDTPVFELKETLTNKYGEDSKLIYDLADQGGELLALRYDLTVPFARYLANHKPGNIKRFHIGRVYRRDNPVMSRGRFREFYQCDFDVAGYESAPPMLVDAECLKVLTEILDQLNLANGYVVKLNHRKLLDAIMAVAGVPADRFRTVCSAIDKLDKEDWKVVRQEIIDKLKLPGDIAGTEEMPRRQKTADVIGEYVKLKDKPFDLLKVLEKDARLSQNKAAVEAFVDLKEMCNYMQAFGMLNKISLDMSLARGLDYYTGVIYEATLQAKGGVDVGSIAAGGRYDGLVGMFSGAAVPAVGVSVGIERIFNILQEQAEKAAAGKPLRTNYTQVLVCTMGSDMVLQRLALVTELWSAGIAAEFSYLKKPSFQAQTDEAKKADIPVAVFIGKEELAGNFVKVKDLRLPPVPGFQGDSVPRKDLVAHIRKILAL